MTCVAFSIKFAKTNQKFAENSEFCEKNSLLLVNYSLHSLVEPELLRDGRALLELRLRARDGVLPGAFEPMFVRTCFLTSLLFSANVKRKVLGCIEADFCK